MLFRQEKLEIKIGWFHNQFFFIFNTPNSNTGGFNEHAIRKRQTKKTEQATDLYLRLVRGKKKI